MEDIRAEVRELRLGEKIRKLRQERRLTLQELSELSGLSKPLLSQIENDQVIPPLATLLKIAKGLKVGIHFFFEEEGDRQKFVLVRGSEGGMSTRRPKSDITQGYLYRPLAPGVRHKKIEPFLVEFQLTEWDDSYYYRHEGEEFIYLVEGELEFHYAGEKMVLKPGDSIYYDSSEPHGYVSVGEKKARAVAVLHSPG
ncbi:helix-turn-helix domain-containing protein [Geobacter sp. DSM 9736]|uniref:helix-turn-helix domain-containing protein n=1 Tax=Geobacter sp. DSM 9736 TaxID=1277350 RepID=UPI000B50C267|nr:cupin domain-containing protein [Geobacter sp. DSM 9736]SNB47764.1 transcriptional regulator, XRE family with cupin sensor [Geobacter sp. DSM 9736]